MRKYINSYKYILHIHTKKSLINNAYGDDWREYLFKNLLGSTENVKRIFTNFLAQEKLGLIFPHTYKNVIPFMSWGTNFRRGKKNVLCFLRKIGIIFPILNKKPVFPSGNMFWARTDAVKKAFNKNITQNYFPVENNQIDMTPAHAVERSWVYIAKNQGYTYKQILNFKSIHD